MRYMGDPVPAPDPTQLAAFIDALPPDKQDALLDAIDASNPGKHRTLMRFALGGGVGLLVGFVAARVLK